jgi:hypothetical protein
MYVRWQRRTRKQRSWLHTHVVPVVLIATLVESHRIEGKPQQRHVAYLGSIQDVNLSSAMHRARFWKQARERLDGVDLPNAERVKIEGALERVVARPTEEEEVTETHELQRLESTIARRR